MIQEQDAIMTAASDVQFFLWVGENIAWLVPSFALLGVVIAWSCKLFFTARDAKFATATALGRCKNENTAEHTAISRDISRIEAKQDFIEAKQAIIEKMAVDHHKEIGSKLSDLTSLFINHIQRNKDA